MRISILLGLCGLWLAATGGTALPGTQGSSGLQFMPRFTRLLKQDLTSVATYLLPTQQPSLCAGNCCQVDSYASPYGLLYQNHSQQVFGGRTYTTFFYQFHANHFCDSALDQQQCCTASADNIWVDVDPSMKVKYVSVNGQRLANSEQNDFGLKLGAMNLNITQAQSGVPITITVEGAADALCPPPGLAPLPGLCEIVVQGSSGANTNACCPSMISANSDAPFPAPDHAFQCSASLDNSPFQLVFDGVSAPLVVAGQQYVSYNFRLVATDSCRADSVTDCCNAQLAYVDLKVTDLPITAVLLDGKSVTFTTSTWNELNSASYRSLVVDNLNLVADDLGTAGLSLTVTVRLPTGSSSTVDLCDASSDPTQGACNYYLHSEDGFCCPSGLALPSNSVPPPPPGTCSPATNVPVAETSMSLQYYEKLYSSATTTFAFLLANHNPTSGCDKPYCVDVCSWTLYLDPSVASQVAVGHENPANNGRQVILGGATASLTFTYGPDGESTTNFFVTLPAGGKSLSDLCARNALPGQGSKACAAVVRSSSVYIMVFFDEADVIIMPGSSSPPPPIQLPTCADARPMSDSCLAVKKARYNTLLTSAVFDFAVLPAASSAACIPPSPPGRSATVHLLLAPAVVDQLTTRGDVQPTTGLALDRNDGARWTVSSTVASNLTFQVQGPLSIAEVCRQGVASDQPANTCVVEVLGDNGCFRGYVGAAADGFLVWINPTDGGSRGVGVAVLVPAVVVPSVVLLLAIMLLAAWYRRRRNARYQYASGSSVSGSLDQPLAGSRQSGSLAASLRDDLSVPSASPSDVQIRVPGASQGGAPPARR